MNDQRSDFVRDGIDFAVSIGCLEDQNLVLQPLERPRRVTVASPAYLGKMGRPPRPEDFAEHHLIDFLLPQPGARPEWEFDRNGKRQELSPRSIASIGDSDARLQLAIAGMGIVQSLCLLAAPALREGKLERILTSWETPGLCRDKDDEAKNSAMVRIPHAISG
jgi:LysR family transcriptional regulator for bpeEF and oprC